MVTPETLTDEMIREHMRWLANQPRVTYEQRRSIRLGKQYCAAALVPDGQRVVSVWWDARERIAEAINTRQSLRR